MPSSRVLLFATALGLAMLPAVCPAPAQQPQPSRIRATIDSVDGNTLAVTARDGTHLTLRTPDNVQVSGIVKIALSDIKAGDYIGVAAMPQADGSQKALSVHLFPEAMRGTAEGFRPWDLRPNSTMTNATVDQTVESNDGQRLTLKYKDGEKIVMVTPETPIVTYVPGDRADLKAGAKIIALATRNEDGSLTAPRISVGKDGLTPPM
ncbi:hypothetical protein [Bradyrhizobium sp. 2TAF24]|uniref:hypothetical protein n=1 Tax=Bradyrhizobium sp. 2TAF24 TaxID=3233011 RepID=UPI003F918687